MKCTKSHEMQNCIEHRGQQSSAVIHPHIMMCNLYLETAKTIPFHRKLSSQPHKSIQQYPLILFFLVSQLIVLYCVFSKIKTVSCQDSFIAFFPKRSAVFSYSFPKVWHLGFVCLFWLFLFSFVFKDRKKEEVIFR